MNVIEVAEREIRRDLDDLSRLKRRYPGYDFVEVEGQRELPVPHGDAIEACSAFPSNLNEAVLGVIDSNPRFEWTSRYVINQLRSSGFTLSEHDGTALNAVGIALVALLATGQIKRVHEGRGRDPHRYVSTKTSEAEEETPAEAGA